MTNMVSKRTFQTNESVAIAFNRVRNQIDQCLLRKLNMYAPAPIPIGEYQQTGTLDESGKTAQIIYAQNGIQSYLIARLSFQQKDNATLIETATKIPQNKWLEPMFASWIENGSAGCKVE